MYETLVNRIPGLGNFSVLACLLVFLGGVLTSLGPCNISMVPVILSYVGGQQGISRGKGFRLSLCFTLGTSITFVGLGVFAVRRGRAVWHEEGRPDVAGRAGMLRHRAEPAGGDPP